MKYFIIIVVAAAGLYWLGHSPIKPGPPRLTLRVMDVGQGDSIYVRLPNNDDILIDGGPDDRVLQELGRALPLGEREIELLIISHNHADHIGGLINVLQHYKVDQIWLSGAIHTTDQYLNLLKVIKEQKIPTTVVKAGSVSQRGETKLTVLHPPIDMTGQQPEDQHAATVVVKISWKDFCTLLTGDLNSDQEAAVIQAAESLHESLGCKVLKVTHHGSAYGSSVAFLNAVQPEIGIISVGRHNLYHHPAPSLLERLGQFGINIYRTDQDGTVTITTDGTNYWTKTAK